MITNKNKNKNKKNKSDTNDKNDKSIDDVIYNVWGLISSYREKSYGIMRTYNHCGWEWVKYGTPDTRCLGNVDKKRYSRLEIRDNKGHVIESVVVPPTLMETYGD